MTYHLLMMSSLVVLYLVCFPLRLFAPWIPSFSDVVRLLIIIESEVATYLLLFYAMYQSLGLLFVVQRTQRRNQESGPDRELWPPNQLSSASSKRSAVIWWLHGGCFLLYNSTAGEIKWRGCLALFFEWDSGRVEAILGGD